MGSAYSNVVQVTSGAPGLILQAIVQSSPVVGGVLQSQNALTWDPIEPDHFEVWRQVAGGGFAFLATVPGVQHTFNDFGPASSWQKVEYDYFVLAKDGSNTTLVQSNTESTSWAPPAPFVWTARTSGSVNGLQSARFGNGVFLTSGAIASISRSTNNGTTWAATDISALVGSVSVNDFAFGAGVWVAVCGAGKIVRSTDNGVTWALASSVPFSTANPAASVAFGNGVFIAGANAAAASTSLYATSADGNTWTLPGTFSTKGWDNHCLLFDGTQFIGIVTQVSGFGLGTSPDGATWTVVTAPPDMERNQPIAFGNGKYMSANQSTPTVRIATTVAGLASAPDSPVTFSPSSAATLTVGYGLTSSGTVPTFFATGVHGQVSSSLDNGATWLPGTLNFSSTNAATGIAFGDSTFVAVGQAGQISTLP